MKHLQKLAEGFGAAAEVNQLLRDQVLAKGVLHVREVAIGDLIAKDTEAAKRYPYLKARARGLMLVINEATQLGGVYVAQIDVKAALPLTISSDYFTPYVAVLHAQPGVLLMSEDESTAIKGGDYWWLRASAEARLINNSDDDCIVMLVEVRVDP